MVLRGIALYLMVSHSFHVDRMVLHGIVLYLTVLHGIALLASARGLYLARHLSTLYLDALIYGSYIIHSIEETMSVLCHSDTRMNEP